MSSFDGKFVWYELMTTDLAAAETFYSAVVGWNAADAGMPGMKYTLFKVGETMAAGAMTLPEEARANGAPPRWIGYVAVDDVDVYAERVAAAGGKVHVPPTDIPNIGRFAVITDPQGAVLSLFKGAGSPPEHMPAPETPGLVGWRELRAVDGATAFDFYSGLFGWTKSTAVDMGPMGIYQLFAAGGQDLGGMMTKMPEMPMPSWLYYFNVDGADAASERIKAAGGQVLNGPHEVPGGSWIVQGRDPQGAAFAVVSPQK